MKDTVKNRLIVALDVETANDALALFEDLRNSVGMFKIGMQLFTAAGPDIVRQIVSRGGRVFLDLKYHDIPNTVAMAGIEAARLGVSIFNIHAAGGSEMMKRTADAVAEVATRENLARPKVIAVTLLTSVDRKILEQIGIEDEPSAIVGRLAQLAHQSGLDGVVASAQEIKIIRKTVPQAPFLIVTPGMRGAADSSNDQRRFMTAAGAVAAGADYVVVGRPILKAADPVQAARELAAEIAKAEPTQPASSDFAEPGKAQSVHSE